MSGRRFFKGLFPGQDSYFFVILKVRMIFYIKLCFITVFTNLSARYYGPLYTLLSYHHYIAITVHHVSYQLIFSFHKLFSTLFIVYLDEDYGNDNHSCPYVDNEWNNIPLNNWYTRFNLFVFYPLTLTTCTFPRFRLRIIFFLFIRCCSIYNVCIILCIIYIILLLCCVFFHCTYFRSGLIISLCILNSLLSFFSLFFICMFFVVYIFII